MESPVLCEKCVTMFQKRVLYLSVEWHGPHWEGDHHPDLKSLINAAENGCYICEPLLQYVLKCCGAIENCLLQPYSCAVTDGLPDNRRISISMPIKLPNGKEQVYRRSFRTIPSSELITKDFSIRTRRSMTLPLLDGTSTAKRWMSECLNGHEQCHQKNMQPSSYPTRLLELRDFTVRIILPAKEKLSGPYAALSYCWGPNPNYVRLTTSNLQGLQDGILCSDLPTAFREAIDFIKSLSVRYLWIDALCIIQSGPGCTKDWLSECAKMQDVYSNCIINLSLSRAANPNESCLGGCNANATLPFEVETLNNICDDESAKWSTCTIISEDYYGEALYNQPLGHRGWALEERLLAPRVLSFGLGELFWDCIQVPNACESFPHGLADLSHGIDLRHKGIPKASDGNTLESAWCEILQEYTERDLTYPEADKLVALSAIATRMGSAMDDAYVAGHFWKSLPYSLNWGVQRSSMSIQRGKRIARRIIGPAKEDKSKRQNKTPSWSWASMDGPLVVKPLGTDERSLADSESYTLSPVDKANPAGQIVSATLKIRAYCTEITWTRGEPVVLSEPRTRGGRSGLNLLVSTDDPDGKPADGTTCWIAALVQEEGPSQAWTGLALEEVETEAEERLYRRVGTFSLSHYHGGRSWSRRFIALFGGKKRTIILC